jgi:cytochrome c oxidase subunit 4
VTETTAAHEAHPPANDAAPTHDAHDDPEHIRKEVRVYLTVFGALGFLTMVTVGVCYYLKLPVHYAIIVALIIASIKGFLVAGYFMHLLTEKKLIYAVLGLTVFFFVVLVWGPWHDIYDKIGHVGH